MVLGFALGLRYQFSHEKREMKIKGWIRIHKFTYLLYGSISRYMGRLFLIHTEHVQAKRQIDLVKDRKVNG